ncbi:hypothetical protein BGX34_011719 [Mortierella sp. NVP85]|nr:hypothetical protein BGX34_011719 [Mortierella sp. NVP85]
MSLGCVPEFSHPLDDDANRKDKDKKSKTDAKDASLTINPQSCFALPVCRSFKETFKNNKADKKGQHLPLIPKRDFTGDPDQAHWTSDFDHIAPYALIDPSQKRLVLKAKRDTVKTKSGGGFGATISSTRWNQYGTFSAKLKSGAHGPGIVTAMMLTNPILGEEITIEVTGRDPKTVITDFYRHSVHDTAGQTRPTTAEEEGSGSVAWLPLSFRSVLHPVSIDGLRMRTRKLKNMILHKDNDPHDDQVRDDTTKSTTEDDGHHHDDGSLEESHVLKKSATENYLVYKIEWTPEKIQWSVDGKVLRTLEAKDLFQQKGYGLPSHPMLLQFTIWDGGYHEETAAWSGGKTNFGHKDEKEYTTLIEWIDIACQDPNESKRNPWPGVDAMKRLAMAEKEEKEEREAREKEAKMKEAMEKERKKQAHKEDKKRTGQHDSFPRHHIIHDKGHASSTEPGMVPKLADSLISLLQRWMFVLVVLTGSASYLTRPESAYARQHYNSLAAKKDYGLKQQ